MNETRDLIIGIDFGKKYSQICYYDRKAEEARSLPVKVGSSLVRNSHLSVQEDGHRSGRILYWPGSGIFCQRKRRISAGGSLCSVHEPGKSSCGRRG